LIKKVVEEDVTRILKPSVLKPSLALRETAVSADAKEKELIKGPTNNKESRLLERHAG
jgi:hypothetical protein